CNAYSGVEDTDAKLCLGEVERVTRRSTGSGQGDAVAASTQERQTHTETPEQCRRRQSRCHDDAVRPLGPPRGLERQGAVQRGESVQLAGLADLHAVRTKALGEGGGQLLGPNIPAPPRAQPGDAPRRVERRLERRERRAVELVDRSALVAELPQAAEDRSVRVEPFNGARGDYETGRMHLERDARFAVGVEQLERASVEPEQR